MSEDTPRRDRWREDVVAELDERTARGKWLPAWLVELVDEDGLQVLGHGLDE